MGCHEVGNSGGEDLCLAASRACDNHDWAVLVQYCFALGVIQFIKIIHGTKLRLGFVRQGSVRKYLSKLGEAAFDEWVKVYKRMGNGKRAIGATDLIVFG